ncbi:MAG: hypothetical protein ACLPY5_00635 [Candidatus Bathyarchaeia archaeon]
MSFSTPVNGYLRDGVSLVAIVIPVTIEGKLVEYYISRIVQSNWKCRQTPVVVTGASHLGHMLKKFYFFFFAFLTIFGLPITI